MARTKVQAELIATNAISGTIIADNAITATHIATNSISGTLIQDSGIVTTMIAANNITSTKIVTDGVLTRHIADDQVTEAKLANAINTSIAAKLPLAGGNITGNLGIGQTSPSAPLDLVTSSNVYAAEFTQSNTSNGDGVFISVGSTAAADYALTVRSDAGNTSVLAAKANGNVGIGTFSPGATLHVDASGGANFQVSRTGVADMVYIEADGTNGVIRQPGDGALVFQMGGTSEKMRIASDGKVGIGTTSPDGQLHVKGATNNTIKLDFTMADGTGTYTLNSYARNGTNKWRLGSKADDSYLSWYNDQTSSHQFALKSDGNVGIGTTSPVFKLHLKDAANTAVYQKFTNDTTGNTSNDGSTIGIDADGDLIVANAEAKDIKFFSGDTERMRIGSTGKASWSAGGIGNVATQSRDFTFYTEGSTNGVDIRSNDYQIAFIGGAGSSGAGMDKGYMQLCLDGGAKIAFNTDGNSYFNGGNVGIGIDGPTAKLHLYTAGAEGINVALQNSERHYKIETDGGNLTFNDISAGGTARMTLQSDGKVFIRNTTGNYDGGQFQMTSGSTCQTMYVSNTGFADPQVVMGIERAASSAYKFFNMYSGRRPDNGGGDVEFQIRGDGNAYADGSWSGGGADYAEYFEWSDGNASSQDRIGLSVVLDGNKIREATGSDAAGTIIGVISGNPAVVGDTAYTKWADKYQKDDYGRYILDSDGHRQENSDYDDSLTYVERENRKEWDTVGLMGKLRMKKGQQTGTNWIKMRDISATVEEWLVR